MGEFDAPLQPLRDVSSVPLGGSLLDTLVQQDSSKTDTGLPGWHVETYAFPAAYPRSAAGSIIDATEKEARAPSSADAKASDKPVKQSKAEVEAAVEETWNRQKAARQYPPDANSSNGPNPLYIAVKRYYRTASKTARGKDGLTLVLAHANGFPKETWEPTLASILDGVDAQKSARIDEIWALDLVNHGQSYYLNQGAMGDTFDWADNGRDILQLLLYYLPEQRHPRESPNGPPPADGNYVRKVGGWTNEDAMVASMPGSPGLPSHPALLPKQYPSSPTEDKYGALDGSSASGRSLRDAGSSGTGAQPADRRWRGRRIVGIGHSVGAAGMIYASSTFPHLFASLVLVDPTIFPAHFGRKEATKGLMRGAQVRRDRWASRDAASALFAKNKAFFGRWHPEVLKRYVTHGLRAVQDGNAGEEGEVELATPRLQEHYVYADPDTVGSKRAFHRLSYLPASLPIHTIRGDIGHSVIPEEISADFERQVKHATHSRVKGAGHLITQEKPVELGEIIARYLSKTFESSESRAKL